MKNHHVIPLILVVAAVIVGTATIVAMQGTSSTPSIVAEVSPAPSEAIISVLSVSADTSLAAAGAAGSRIVQWQTQNYPATSKVNINLIKKVSSDPSTYELVRVIATDSPNDGTESWTPAATESGDSFFIEVVCSANQTFSGGCRANTAPTKAF